MYCCNLCLIFFSNSFDWKVVRDEDKHKQKEQAKTSSATSSPSGSPASSIKQPQYHSKEQVTSVTHAQAATENDMDNFELIACIVRRREDFPGIGLSLSTAINHPSRGSSPEQHQLQPKSNDQINLPIITNIDENSPAQQSGLRVGDLVLEINGKSTNGQTNPNIAKWIRSGGTTLEFLVSFIFNYHFSNAVLSLPDGLKFYMRNKTALVLVFNLKKKLLVDQYSDKSIKTFLLKIKPSEFNRIADFWLASLKIESTFICFI